jgi:hypothetical protein
MFFVPFVPFEAFVSKAVSSYSRRGIFRNYMPSY